MRTPVHSVDWIETDEKLNELMSQEDILAAHPMDQGFEAEVMRISSDKESFVLKVWNRNSKPNIRFQFQLLNFLYQRGLSVSKPVGWGMNSNMDQVLLTTFDGTAINKVDDKKMTEIANILSSIHKLPVGEARSINLPQYNFIDYFFPRVKEEHTDIYNALAAVVQTVQIKQQCLVHGDFHLRNIVEEDNRFTVIDWTNGQLGDPRYDFAWSLILKKIYLPERYANVFRAAYLMNHPIKQDELEAFEALACLRWILLQRYGGTPKEPKTMEKVRKLLSNNLFLKELDFQDITIKKKIWSGDGMNNEALFEQFPILKSEDIVLKKIEEHHLDEVYEIYSNDKVFEYCGIIPKHNKDTVKNMIGHFERDYNKKSRIKWGIFASAEPDRLLGIIEAFDFNQKVNAVTIGYFLSESHWGKGIAGKSVNVLIEFLFNDAHINRIQAEVMPLNDSSKKVLLKNGFTYEGTLRQASLWSGKGVVDLEVYSLLKAEYS